MRQSGPASVAQNGGLLALALLSLVSGGAAGLVGALFRRSLEQADRLRGGLITWAHGTGLVGCLLVVAGGGPPPPPAPRPVRPRRPPRPPRPAPPPPGRP